MNKTKTNKIVKYAFSYEGNEIGIVFYNKDKEDIDKTTNVELIFGVNSNDDDIRFPLMGVENKAIKVTSFSAFLVKVVDVIKVFKNEFSGIDINFKVVKTLRTEVLETKASLYKNALGGLIDNLEDNGNFNYTLKNTA